MFRAAEVVGLTQDRWDWVTVAVVLALFLIAVAAGTRL